jgi:hypothetical protein
MPAVAPGFGSPGNGRKNRAYSSAATVAAAFILQAEPVFRHNRE